MLGLEKGLHRTECQHAVSMFLRGAAVKLLAWKVKDEPQARQLEEIPDRIMGLRRESGETKQFPSGQKGGR